MHQTKRNDDTQMQPRLSDPGDVANKLVRSLFWLFGLVMSIFIFVWNYDWFKANGLWLAPLVIGVITLILKWPVILKAITDYQDRKAKRAREDELNKAQADHLYAKSEDVRGSGKIKVAEAWQKSQTLPFDANGNLARFDWVNNRVDYTPGKAPEFPNLTHNAPRYAIREENHQGQGELPAPAGRQLAMSAPQGIPAIYDLEEVFRHHVDVAPDSIFLARTDQCEHLTVDGNKELCHGVFNAIPGKGKTIVERGLASQLLHAEYTVTFLDLKFALITEDGLDYRPMAKKMWDQPPMRVVVDGSVYEVPHIVRNEDDIQNVLHFLAYDEIEHRLRMRDAGDFSFPTHFFFLDDMLAFMQQHPEAADDLIRVLTLGRELRLKLFTAAQNFQNKETKLSGGAKSIFETAYFLGGDHYSGAKVLDVPERDLKEYLTRHNVNLGKGLTLLRNNAVAPVATLARVGMASNDAIYYHHGHADDFRMPPRSETYTPEVERPKRRGGGEGRPQLQVLSQQDYLAAVPDEPVRRPSKVLTPQLQTALDAYNRGFTSSRALAEELKLGKTRGAELLHELKRRKLI